MSHESLNKDILFTLSEIDRELCDGPIVFFRLRDDFTDAGDLDFLVSFEDDSNVSLFDIIRFQDELAQRTGRKVDLVEEEAVRNPIRRKTIFETREIIYQFGSIMNFSI